MNEAELDDFVKEVIGTFGWLLTPWQWTTGPQLAVKILEVYDIENPKIDFAYSALCQTSRVFRWEPPYHRITCKINAKEKIG